MRTAKELVATGRENDGSDMPRRAAFPRFIPGLGTQPRTYLILKYLHA